MKSPLITIVVIVVIVIGYLQLPKFGKLPVGKKLERLKQSKNYKNGMFHNLQAMPYTISAVRAVLHFLFGSKNNTIPSKYIPTKKIDLFKLDSKDDVLFWFGHSSYFLQVEGKRILVDPVFSNFASPIPFAIRAFKGTNKYKADDIPDFDYLIITHDHWDHLDYSTIKRLKNKIKTVICPLGVGVYLEYWGFNSIKIIEMDWENKVNLDENFSITCLPSQHFSGRGLVRNKTLWASFLIETPSFFKIFLGCDGGYSIHFSEIGNKFNGIDFAILENGQYNENWKYIHMHPDEVLQAAIDLKAKFLLPVHVAKFKLSTHPWNEPLEKLSELSKNKCFKLLTPLIGEKVYLKNNKQTFTKWWNL